jgi:hypothetical protein
MKIKYKTIKLPLPVYINLNTYKTEISKEVSKWSGKDIKLTTPKFLNALVSKSRTIDPIIPFNKGNLFKLSKKRRGIYDL